MRTKFIFIYFLCCITCALNAQNISGVINTYTKVTAISCNKITTTSATGYTAGDTVLIIQMKGALVDTSKTDAFGSILNYNEAGNYEFNVIQSVTTDTVYLEGPLQKLYDPNAFVQLIRVPYYNNVTVSGTLTADPWDGNTGGVLVLTAAGSITMNANIDVTGLGFRGGSASINYFDIYSYICPDDQYYSISSGLGAPKGESIAITDTLYAVGRGALANGGGGGNHVNAGGAGGSNTGKGGQGGYASTPCPNNTDIGGIGAYTLNYNNTDNKIFLGGGGGGAHQNDDIGTDGTNGGGIVITRANTITGNNNSIIADGVDNNTPTGGGGYDAAGGGGSGGTILMEVANYNLNLNIRAEGGKGGDINSTTCHGPGGGGGGGTLWISSATLPSNVSVSLNPGLPGTHAVGSCNSYGADTGTVGTVLYNLQIPPPIPSAISTSADSICIGNSVTLNANSGYVSYSWLPGGQTTSQISVSPLTTSTYTLASVDSNACIDTSLITITVNDLPIVKAGEDDTICNGESIQLNGSGAASYNWNPSSGLNNSTIEDPTSTPSANITYTLTGTDANGCVNTDTVNIVVESPTQASFTATPTEGQIPLTVNFINTSTNASIFTWTYGDDIITEDTTTNPIHIYTEGGEYNVQLIANNTDNCPDTAYATIRTESASVLWIPNSFTPNADGENDLFIISGSGILKLEVEIFNRWGELIYEWNTLTGAWDGTHKGTPVEQEVYVYVVKAKGIDNKDYKRTGHVSLIR